MNRILVNGIAILISMLMACSPQITGTNDETHTRVATLYRPDLSPAEGATVKLFRAGDSLRIPEKQVITGPDGKYSFGKIEKGGYYNVWAQLDSFVAFQDSLFAGTMGLEPKDDTLFSACVFRGFVSLQPNHDPQSITVQVLGSNRFANVSDLGVFLIPGMAPGRYTLRLTTTEPGYTATFRQISISRPTGGVVYTPVDSDTIRMIYTGIPVVRGLTAQFDSASGSVTLTWNRVSYFNLRDYLIYRDEASVVEPSRIPIASRVDTFFVDSLNNFEKHDTSGNANLVYRVAARSRSLDVGESFESVGVTIYGSPLLRLEN